MGRVYVMSKKTVMKGAIILTLTGILTRFIGFGYRIFLSSLIGAAQLGIYQMIFPVFGICATIYGVGIQTAISHLTAAWHDRSIPPFCALITGILLSLSLSLSLSGLIFWQADFIAEKLLLEPACEEPLRILVFLFPFCGISSCIHGWYYGNQKTAVPAMAQLLEQCVRVGVVYMLSASLMENNLISGCELAVAGMCAGEIASCLFTVISFFFTKREEMRRAGFSRHCGHISVLPSGKKGTYTLVFKKLLHLALPLTGNRLIVNILAGTEAILIPACLKKYGLSSEEALAVYGVLTGMCLPFLMFPSTITNSLAVLLLPAVAQAQASGQKKQLERTCSVTIHFCLLIGLLSASIFILLGNHLGRFFFHSTLAGKYLTILAWLCPFLYLTAALGSVLNGLNKAGTTLFNNAAGLGIRLLFVLYCIPSKGMEGYLAGMLISQLSTFFLDLIAISKEVKIKWNLFEWIVKPGITLACAGFLLFHCFHYFTQTALIPEFFCMACVGAILFLTSLPYFYQCVKSV